MKYQLRELDVERYSYVIDMLHLPATAVYNLLLI